MSTEAEQAGQIVRDLVGPFRVTVLEDRGGKRGLVAESEKGGCWPLEELRILHDAVADLAGAMGGAEGFVARVGPVVVSRESIAARGLAYRRRIRFTASSVSIDKWTVVHELGHVWDANCGWRLSRALEVYTGGRTNWLAGLMKGRCGRCDAQSRLPGCNRSGYYYNGPPPAGADRNLNRREDFAESVAAYVYPAVAQQRVARFENDERYGPLLYYADYTQTARHAYIDGLIRGNLF